MQEGMMIEKNLPDEKSAERFYLRASEGRTFNLDPIRNLQTMSFEWAYRIRNRQMWVSCEKSRYDISRNARKDLLSMGISESDLDFLAGEPVIEVNIPYSNEATGWELRTMPWEYFLSTAICKGENDPHPLIIRRLQRDQGFKHGNVEKFLFVLSAPGNFENLFQFDDEKKLIETSLEAGRDNFSFEVLHSPTREELKKKILEFEPNAVHLTGVDSHEGAELLGLGSNKHRCDGFYLRDEKRQPVMVASVELAAIINCGAIKPSLLTCNTYHSAPRTGALSVAEGSELGLGFQDTVDNARAELFLSYFYRAWKVSGFKTLSAFQLAFEQMKADAKRNKGGGIVLWSANSLLEHESQAVEKSARQVLEVKRSLDNEKLTRFDYKKGTGDGGLREQLTVHVRPKSNLNYTLLHNNQDLFEEFRLRKYTPSNIQDIDIEVMLQIGSDRFHYRRMFDMNEQVADIAGDIRVPLTWEFARSLKESIHTNLYISVSYDGETICRETEQVLLLPSDEWLDTKRDGKWLPSFVFPRNRKVRQIIAKAQHYLMAINDDPHAGFDGYQSGDPDLVDCEVQAIWSALVYDYGLSYIDPPPTYTHSSQRLRTPEDVITGGRGTCIDLALLFAACLEYIGLYPVIFLMQGHAFPGYWRDFAYHAHFVEMHDGVGVPSGDDMSSAASMQLVNEDPWMIEEEGFDQLLSVLLNDEVVPVETVCLTSNDSFSEACEQAIMTLRNRDFFDAMVDIQIARKSGVTPLPLRGSEQ
jgi:hypothetical protein